MNLSEQAPYKPISEEQLEGIRKIFEEHKDRTTPDITLIPGGFKVEQMYEYVTVNFALLSALAELLGTKNIDTDQWSRGGCETCDFGSNYCVEFYVREDV